MGGENALGAEFHFVSPAFAENLTPDYCN
jgi:hypothetical protein